VLELGGKGTAQEEAAWHRGGLEWCDAIAPQQTPVSTGVGKTSDGVEASGRTGLRRTVSGGGDPVGMGLVRVADWLSARRPAPYGMLTARHGQSGEKCGQHCS
jgi:hypothetical protein